MTKFEDDTVKTRSFLHAATIAGLAICACLLFSVAAYAQLASLPLFEGSWAGPGTLSHENGLKERILCRVDYTLRGPQTLRQNLRCLNDATNFDIVSTFTAEAGRVTGDWTEITRQAQGTLAGTFRGGDIRAQVRGGGFAADVGIAVKGNKQSVDIRVAGADITDLDIALTRARQ